MSQRAARSARPLLISIFALGALALPAGAQDRATLFSDLVAARDIVEFERVLSRETLSTSTVTIAPDGRLDGGPIYHGVSAHEIATKLVGCTVESWRDTPKDETGEPFVLWTCPAQQIVETPCYYRSYRAALLDPRWHSDNLFVHAMATRDPARCSNSVAPPPKA